MSRSSFASRTTFEALQVDSGEESEEEEVPEAVVESSSLDSGAQSHAKLSKSAQKKAARTARVEKKQQQKIANKLQRTESPSADNSRLSSEEPLPTHLMTAQTSADVALEVGTAPVVPPATDSDADAQVDLATSSDFLGHKDHDKQHSSSTDSTWMQEVDAAKPISELSQQRPKDANANGETVHPKNDAQEAEKTKKMQNVFTRTLWTFIMIGGFIGLLLLGHVYMILLVMLCQTLVYREVTALFSLKSTAPDSYDSETRAKDPWSKTLNWYFFAVTNYFLYGESIIYYFKHVVFADAQLLPFATNHRIISFTLYTIGFVGFVMSLKKGYLKQQFGLFCWVHMSLLLIVVSSHFLMNNILEGLIWFWVPASLVICNDVFAYIWGITIGHTPLIKLSPKKTVEGFVGAFGSTIVFGILWGTYFMRYDYMICPVHDLGVSAWSSSPCTPNPVFVWKDWVIWPPLAACLSTIVGRPVATIPYAPYQFHLLFMSFFASLVAPFGGFFASGFKRAFNIKDFGDSIPGHGGMTDRMDCQFLMGVFTYVYYSSLIREHHATVGSILQTIVSGLTVDEQLELIADLRHYLEGKGIKVV